MTWFLPSPTPRSLSRSSFEPERGVHSAELLGRATRLGRGSETGPGRQAGPRSTRRRSALPIFALASILFALPTGPATAGEPTEGLLYWAQQSGGGLWRAPLDGAPAERFVRSFRLAPAIALDVANSRLYYGHDITGTDVDGLYSADLAGGDRQRLAPTEGPITDLEVDPGGGFVYWVDLAGVHRVSSGGGPVEDLVAGATAGGPFIASLGLDPSGARLYYGTGTELRSATLLGLDDELVASLDAITDVETDPAGGKIYLSRSLGGEGVTRLDFDGSSYEVLVGSPATNLEVAGGQVYFRLNAGSRELQRVELDGSNPVEVSTGIDVGIFDLDPAEGHVYRVDVQLSRFDLDGQNGVPLLAAIGNFPHDMAVDTTGQRLLICSDNVDASLLSTPLDRVRLDQLSIGDPAFDKGRGAAFDPVSGNFFAVSGRPAPDGALWRVAADGGGTMVAILGGLDAPHDVAIDVDARRLYWTEGTGSSSALGASIRSADLDGQNATTVLADLPRSIRGLDLDPDGGTLYWADLGNDQVWSAGLDGSNAAPLLAADNPHDVAVDRSGGKLYWSEGIGSTEQTSGSIRRANLDGTGVEPVLVGLSSFVRDLSVAYHAKLFLFDDGFESGNTERWSLTTP